MADNEQQQASGEQYFDFEGAALGNAQPSEPSEQLLKIDSNLLGDVCLLHGVSDCECLGTNDNWNALTAGLSFDPNSIESLDLDYPPLENYDLDPAATLPVATDLLADQDPVPDYSAFNQWIPGFHFPDHSCDYCKSHQLNCYIIYQAEDGQSKEELLTKSCTSCKALFRPCSFILGPDQNACRGRLDTLHPLGEDVVALGGQTSSKPTFTLGATFHDMLDDHLERGTERSLTRFSRETVRILKDWLDSHKDNPYPSEKEKDELKKRTGLKKTQISNWLANARRRGKAKKRNPSPGPLGFKTQPIDIPKSAEPHSMMSPLERWKHSPPEHEAAKMTNIIKAIATSDLPSSSSGSTSRSHSNSVVDLNQSSSASSFVGRGCAGPSSTSQEIESIYSWQSESQSSLSQSISQGSHSSYNSLARKERRRRRRAAPVTTRQSGDAQDSNKRPFHCTFCCDSFASKYDWTRHEKSLHLSLETWTCAPAGPTIITASGELQCVYCNAPNPTPEHSEGHNHRHCEEKDLASRTFYRKDHLRQHLRLVHEVPLQPSMEKWRSAPPTVRSRCGFCNVTFTTWSDRADHLAKHFRAGKSMAEWHGGWGFDPQIANLVTQAIPPFLVGWEATTMIPFSATQNVLANTQYGATTVDTSVVEGVAFGGKANCGTAFQGATARGRTCWEVLTLHLGEYAREQQEAGVRVTDEMLQRRARFQLYGSDEDEWNQTAADNPEWLRLFKKAHGIASNDDAADADATADENGIHGTENQDFVMKGWVTTTGIEKAGYALQGGINDIDLWGTTASRMEDLMLE